MLLFFDARNERLPLVSGSGKNTIAKSGSAREMGRTSSTWTWYMIMREMRLRV